MGVEKVCCFEGLSQGDSSRKGWHSYGSFCRTHKARGELEKEVKSDSRFQTWSSRKMKDDNFELRHIDFKVLDINYYELKLRENCQA